MMTDDRTKPHPLYWIEIPSVCRWAAGFATPADIETYGEASNINYGSKELAVAQTWAHADALRREGYMLALERVRDEADKNANMECSRWAYEAAATVEDQAPGEAE